MLTREKALDGNWTLLCRGAPLLSTRKPLLGVQRFVAALELGEHVNYVLFGDPCGYLSESLMQRGVSRHALFRFPVLGAYGGSLTPVDLSCSADVFENQLAQGRKWQWIALPSVVQSFPEQYAAFLAWYQETLRIAVENWKVTLFFSRVWWRNAVKNLRLPVPCLHMEPRNEHVVLVAAGPSLEAVVSDLAQKRAGYRVIAVLAALPSLLEVGVVPDAVVLSDGGVFNQKHAQALRTYPIPLLGTPFANHATILHTTGAVFWYHDATLQTRYILNSSTVLIAALRLCARVFTGSIVLLGADFAYPFGRFGHAHANALDANQIWQWSRFTSWKQEAHWRPLRGAWGSTPQLDTMYGDFQQAMRPWMQRLQVLGSWNRFESIASLDVLPHREALPSMEWTGSRINPAEASAWSTRLFAQGQEASLRQSFLRDAMAGEDLFRKRVQYEKQWLIRQGFDTPNTHKI